MPFIFANDVRKHWGGLVTSGATIGLLGIWQGTGHRVPATVFWAVAVVGLLVAIYRTWLDEHKKAVATEGRIEAQEKRLLEGQLEELQAQKRRRDNEEADRRYKERLYSLTAPDSGIRAFAKRKQTYGLNGSVCTVEELVGALEASQSEIEDALNILHSRGFAKPTSLPGRWLFP